MIEIIPAIDIIDGHAVRLTKGDYDLKKVYDVNPVDMAKKFSDIGVNRIHMVDLDGAKVSHPKNLSLLEEVAASVDVEVEWGGGIYTSKDLKDVFSAGAAQAIIGSIAVKDQELLISWLNEFGNRIILGADTNSGKVAIKGWTETSSMTIDDLINRFAPYGLDSVICTDISKDGMLQGPAVDLYCRLISKYPDIVFTASGGVSSMNDIMELNDKGVKKVIVGKAIYENKISMEDIEKWSQNV